MPNGGLKNIYITNSGNDSGVTFTVVGTFLGVHLEELRHLGWTEGGNIQLDVRFAARDSDRLGVFATELVGFSPEVVVASSPLEVRAVQQQTRSIPIVFTAAVDPVSQGLVRSIRHPGGNVTGCSSFEFSMGGKWVELLKEVAPNTARVAVIFNPKTAPYIEEILRSIEVCCRFRREGRSGSHSR